MSHHDQGLADEWAIRRTLERYCRAVDDSAFDCLAALFTDDAVLEFGGQVLVGADAIRGYFDQVHGKGAAPVTGVHLLGNCVIDFDDELRHEASVSTDFVHVWRVGTGGGVDAAAIVAGEHLGQIPVAGRYVDRMRRTGDRWLIAERRAQLFAPSPRQAGAQPVARRADGIRMRTTVQVREGCLPRFRELLERAAHDSLAEVADNASGLLGYSAHLDPESGVAVLYEHHADLAALAAHLAVDPERRAGMRELCDQRGPTEVYGNVPEQLLATLTGLGIDVRVYPVELGTSGLL